MTLKQTGIYLFSFLCVSISVRADQAQFSNSTFSGTSSSPVSVALQSSSFTISISNSISGEAGWAPTPIPIPPFSVPGDPTGGILPQSVLSTDIQTALDDTELNLLGFKGTSGATVTLTLNFSSLPGGYLPAGSLLVYADVDHSETATLTGPSGWFNLSTISTLDVTSGGYTIPPYNEPAPGPADMTGFSGSGAILTLLGQPAATDTPGVIIPLAINVNELTIVATVQNGTFFQGLGIETVPEPTTLSLLGLGAVPILLAQWARLKKKR